MQIRYLKTLAGAVAAFGPAILARGCDLVVASVGALADPDLMAALEAAARASGAQCVVPAGAIGGIDALGTARLSGLSRATFDIEQLIYRDSLEGTICCRGGVRAAFLNADTLKPQRVPASLFEDNPS